MEVRIVTVGDELLAGDTVNTNATWLCARLYDQGVRVSRVSVVPDDIEEIASIVRRDRKSADAVIVTGGVGPTHDDVTLDGIAHALNRPLETNEEAQQWLESEGGYSADNLADGTAALPAGAQPIHNEVGVAPGAVVSQVYVFPGVPEEMHKMFESVQDEFIGEQRARKILWIDEPESHLIDRFSEIRDRFDVAIGSYPGDCVRVVISGTHEEAVDAAATWLASRSEMESPDNRPDPQQGDDDT